MKAIFMIFTTSGIGHGVDSIHLMLKGEHKHDLETIRPISNIAYLVKHNLSGIAINRVSTTKYCLCCQALFDFPEVEQRMFPNSAYLFKHILSKIKN